MKKLTLIHLSLLITAALVTPVHAIEIAPHAPVTQTTTAPAAKAEKSYQLYAEDIEKAVSDALIEGGAGKKVKATVVGRRTLPLYEATKPVSVEIRTLRFDSQKATWTANLLFNSDEKTESAMPVSGRYQEMVAVPVLKKRATETDVISASDITAMDYPLERLQKNVLLDETKIIGKSPRRTVSENRPIREDELTQPRMVEKNSQLRLRYTSGPLAIELGATALEEGGVGQTIRVKNNTSGQILQAVVDGAGAAHVVGPSILSAARTAVPQQAEQKTAAIEPSLSDALALPANLPANNKTVQ